MKKGNKVNGGVDKQDWLVSKYAASVGGKKKWYWPVFT